MRTPEQREIIRQAEGIRREERKARLKARPPKVQPTAEGQRRPRVRDNARLKYVRRCPCLACEILGETQTTPTRAAHVRSGYPEGGWPHTGKGEKPSDFRTLPLCDEHHTDGPNAQHKANEKQWWARLNIYPPAAVEQIGTAFASGEDPHEAIRRIAHFPRAKLRRSA